MQIVKLACFSTAANIRNNLQSLFCEMVGTFVLILPIFLMASPTMKLSTGGEAPTLGLGSIGLLPVALLVFGIGLSLGGTTGYAINPARDLGPRIAHAILPIPGKTGWRLGLRVGAGARSDPWRFVGGLDLRVSY